MEPRTQTDSMAPVGIAEALGDDTVVFNVELLLRAGGVFAFDDEVGCFKRGGDAGFGFVLVARVHQILLEAVGCASGVRARPDDARRVVGFDGGFGFFDGEDAGQRVVLNLDAADGGDERGLVRVREQQDGLVGVVDVRVGEAGMVLGEMDDGVFAGNIGCADDGELRPVDGGVKRDAADGAAGDARSAQWRRATCRGARCRRCNARRRDLRATFLAKGRCS
jgi:hypothetical protein